MNIPTVSIIIISKNNYFDLLKTLRSLKLIIDLDLHEVIIQDASDKRNDISEFQKEYSNFFYFFEKDKGIFDAHNKGIKKSSKEYIYILNSGDILSHTINFSKIITNAKLNNPYMNLISFIVKRSDGLIISNKKKITSYFPFSSHSSGILYEKILHTKYGYYDDINFPLSADAEFFSRIKKKLNVVYLNKSFSIFDNSGISSQKKIINKIYYEEFRHRSSKNIYMAYLILIIRKIVNFIFK